MANIFVFNHCQHHDYSETGGFQTVKLEKMYVKIVYLLRHRLHSKNLIINKLATSVVQNKIFNVCETKEV